MGRVLGVLLGALILTGSARVAVAADVPYGILVDGRRVDASGRSGLERGGVLFVNVVRAVKVFDGLLTFDKRTVRLTIRGRTLVFRLGSTRALLDDTTLRLAGAPFRVRNDAFVPLAPVAAIAHAKVHVDEAARVANLQLEPSVATAEIQPSPARALAFDTSAAIDGGGLHARVTIANVTGKPYALDFPAQAQVAFVVMRDGEEVWNSAAPRAPLPAPSRLTFEAHETKTFTATWPGFAQAGPGRYMLRVRLLTAQPLDTAPVSVGVATPAADSSR